MKFNGLACEFVGGNEDITFTITNSRNFFTASCRLEKLAPTLNRKDGSLIELDQDRSRPAVFLLNLDSADVGEVMALNSGRYSIDLKAK